MVRNMGAPSYAATFTAPVLAAIVVAGDRTVRLWSVTDHSCIKVFEGHASSVLRVRFVRAGMQLVTAGADGLVKLWSVKDNLVRIYPCSSRHCLPPCRLTPPCVFDSVSTPSTTTPTACGRLPCVLHVTGQATTR